MDNKTIFIKTKKGMDEMQGRTTHLPGDIKRALLMVDGDSSFAEISKRAAPSLRSSLEDLFQELVKGGYIQDKDKVHAQARGDIAPRMSVPVKIATPKKGKAENRDGELDFMSGYAGSSQSPAAESAKARILKAEAEENIQLEIEAAKYAQQEAEARLRQTEQEQARRTQEAKAAAKLRAEQEARMRQEQAERERQQQADRLKEEQEALQVRIKLDQARERAQAAARQHEAPSASAPASKQTEDDKMREEAERIVRQAREIREREEAARKEALLREEAERIVRLEREAREREEQARRVREEAERIVRLEREAREREELARKAREEAERILREQQAREREEQARRAAREEADRLLRLEQEAREREAQARKEALVREEVQRLIRQEQQQEREAQSRDQSPPASAGTSEGWGLFSFDTFQVDDPLYTSESHIDRKAGKNEAPPAQKARPGGADAGGQSAAFAFDAFQVDEPPLPVEKSEAEQPVNPARPARAAAVEQPDKQRQAAPSTGNKPVPQQTQRASQERVAAEARVAEEASEAKKASEAQARVWAEAEQRALKAARAEADQASKQAALAMADAPAARPTKVARARRKSFSWGNLAGLVFKLGLILLVLIAGTLFIIPYVVSTREYLPKAEQMLGEKLHQPVHVGSLSGRILPTPRLELGEVYIGDAKQLQVKVAQINFPFTALFTDVKPVNSVELQDIRVRGAWLGDASGWLQKIASQNNYPVSRMLISKGTLDADAFALSGIEGQLNFAPGGKFVQGELRANGGKYDAIINAAAPDDRLNIALTVRDSALPLLPDWAFDVLTAKGMISNNSLSVTNFDGQLFGGAVEGNADISWRPNWAVQGTLNAKRINMQKLNKLLDGNVDGSMRFRMASADLAKLTVSTTLDGSFNSSDGTISGLEIADTARKLSRENLPGGRTHYDALNGNFSFEGGVYRFKQARIAASALSANANFDIDTSDQQLSGKMGVVLSLPGRTVPAVDLKLGGTVDIPTLVYAP